MIVDFSQIADACQPHALRIDHALRIVQVRGFARGPGRDGSRAGAVGG